MLLLPKSSSGTFKIYNMILVLAPACWAEKSSSSEFFKAIKPWAFLVTIQTFWKRFVQVFSNAKMPNVGVQYPLTQRSPDLGGAVWTKIPFDAPENDAQAAGSPGKKKGPGWKNHLKNQTTINCWGFKMLVFLGVTSKRPSISEDLRKSRKNHGVVFFLGWRFKGSSRQRFNIKQLVLKMSFLPWVWKNWIEATYMMF